MKEKNAKKTFVIILSTILALAGVVFEILGNIQWSGQFRLTPEAVSFIVFFIAITYYVLAGYKKPHGNLLRYTFLLLAFNCVNAVIDTTLGLIYETGYDVDKQLLIIGLYSITILFVSYIAGRLDKIKSNYLPMIIITISQIIIPILFLSIYNGWSNITYIIWDASTCLLWIDLLVAYIIRYREHKEAGLLDK